MLLNRLWPLLLATVASGGLAFLFPQVPGIFAGFAMAFATALRHQEKAVSAIEERDGAAFYVERTHWLRPIQLVRTPSFRRDVASVEAKSFTKPTSAGARTSAGRKLPTLTSLSSESLSEIPMMRMPPALVSAASGSLPSARMWSKRPAARLMPPWMTRTEIAAKATPGPSALASAIDAKPSSTDFVASICAHHLLEHRGIPLEESLERAAEAGLKV